MMKVEVIVKGNIPSKSNSYAIARYGSNRGLIKKDKVIAYEREFKRQVEKLKGLMISTPFSFVADVYYSSNRSDVDGCLKVVLDCLQSCGVIKNDRLCYHIDIVKHVDKDCPRIEFSIEYE